MLVGPTAEIVKWACWGRLAPPCVPDTTQDGPYPFTVAAPDGTVLSITIAVAGGRGAYTFFVSRPGVHRICEVGRTPAAVLPAGLALLDGRCVDVLLLGLPGDRVEFFNLRPLEP